MDPIPADVWKGVTGPAALGVIFLVVILVTYKLIDKLIDKSARATEAKDARFAEAIGKLDATLDRISDRLTLGDKEIRKDISEAVNGAQARHTAQVQALQSAGVAMREAAEKMIRDAVENVKIHVTTEAKLTRSLLRGERPSEFEPPR